MPKDKAAKGVVKCTTDRRPRVRTPKGDQLGNAAIGAVIGGVVAGPVGAVAGAAVGAGIEKGPTPRKRKNSSDRQKGYKPTPRKKATNGG